MSTKTFAPIVALLIAIPCLSQETGSASRLLGGTESGAMAVSTSINGPTALAVDKLGHLFVVESEEDRVLRIDLGTGIIAPVAGKRRNERCREGDGGLAVDACLKYPTSLATDSSGNLLIAEMPGRVRKVDAATGLISTIAGGGQNRKAEGIAALSADFGDIDGIAVDAKDNLFVASNELEEIFKVDRISGTVSRFAGNGRRGYSGDGGLAVEASFNFGSTISLDAEGNLLIGDYENCRIRQVGSVSGVVTTIAVTGHLATDGSCVVSNLKAEPLPTDPVADRTGNVYFVEGAMDVVKRIDAETLSITTYAGTGAKGFRGDNDPANEAFLNNPSGLAVDEEGNVFIAEFVNNRIRRVDAKTGIIITVGGDGLPHRVDVMM